MSTDQQDALHCIKKTREAILYAGSDSDAPLVARTCSISRREPISHDEALCEALYLLQLAESNVQIREGLALLCLGVAIGLAIAQGIDSDFGYEFFDVADMPAANTRPA